MKRLQALSVLLLLAAGSALALTSDPQGIPSASGDSSNSNFSNFQVVGENAAGITGNTNYVCGVGLAPMIFQPLITAPGTYIPTIPSGEGDVISYPNPFNPDTGTSTIAYKLATDARVQLYILDVTGSLIRKVITSSASRGSDGYSRYGWDGTNSYNEKVANGVYLVRVTSAGQSIGKTKVVAVR